MHSDRNVDWPESSGGDSSPPMDTPDAPTLATMRMQAIAMAHVWVVGVNYRPEGRGAARFYIRAGDLDMNNTVINQGRRIKVEICMEDDS